jgi:hypothetical protein
MGIITLIMHFMIVCFREAFYALLGNLETCLGACLTYIFAPQTSLSKQYIFGSKNMS